MPYQFLENIAIADAAFQAWGDTVEEMFVAASEALLRIMIENPDAVRPRDHRSYQVEETRIDMLLFQSLQELIYYKDAERLLLRVKTVRVAPHGEGWTASVGAVGEPIDPVQHDLIVDVKAVTLHRFQVEQTARGWDATVVVDV
jgi:SHS2 domain-containing protein